MTDPERRRLVLTEEDMAETAAPAAPPPPARAPAQQPPAYAPPPEPPPAAAQQFPTVGGVGAPRRVVSPGSPAAAPPALPAWLNVNTVIGRSIVAAAAGIALGWAVTEILGLPDWTAESAFQRNWHVGVFVGMLGVIFAVVYAGWEHILARSPEGLLHVARTSGPVGAGLGFVSGFIAQVVFAELLEAIDSTGGGIFVDPSDVRLYLARALAWGLFGMGVGAASAVLIRSRQKLINGVVGGAIGGAIGGLVFHWVVLQMPNSQGTARLVGLLFVGVGIGVATGLIETARRDAWLNVIGGAMTGKEFIVYEAETKVGSDPKCEIVLIKDPAINPYHFVINTPAGSAQHGRTLIAYEGCAVSIQGQPVARHTLRDGDVIGVGTTSIKYSERAAQQPLPGGI